MNPQAKYLVALSRNRKIGARNFQRILKRFNDLGKLWGASASALIKHGLDPNLAQTIAETVRQFDPEEEHQKLRRLAIDVLTILDDGYPSLLREIPDPPALLYIRGGLKREDSIGVAVVGSRKATDYGRVITRDVVSGLVDAGVTIVSGLAIGIDAVAHETALLKGGRTIAVLANGLDSVYPVTNRRLAERIITSGGALLSEFPIGTKAYDYNFPIRNRIIAGLTLGTLVIEAAEKSGSLLTARSAIEYNREVFAVPNPIYSVNAVGPNNLIRLGAKLVTSTEDILNELRLTERRRHHQTKQLVADSKEEALIIASIGREPVHVDLIVKRSKLNTSVVNATLTLMEMKGKVRNLGGNTYIVASS